MNTKFLKIGASLITIIVLIGGAFFYKYSYQGLPVQNQVQQEETPTTTIETPQNPLPPSDGILSNPEIEVTGKNPGLIICADKCGDGICQDATPTCDGGNLNCICQENKQECFQDCK